MKIGYIVIDMFSKICWKQKLGEHGSFATWKVFITSTFDNYCLIVKKTSIMLPKNVVPIYIV